MTFHRLKVSEVSVIRERMVVSQGGRCAICSLPIKRPCLDHDHSTGAVRAACCSGCNALLGKIENNYKRYGVTSIAAFCGGVAGYLGKHSINITGYLHPSHKSEDEKRVARNTKARKKRAATKVQ